jgi:hypothetical protein
MSSPDSSRRLRVFLCHASVDKPRVRQLYQQIGTTEVEVWFDEEHLLPGQDWELEIRRVVRRTDIVLVCLSQQSVSQRGFRHKEIKMALDIADEQPEGAIFIIPAKLEECEIPDRLHRWHWVNLFDEQGYQRLLQALKHRANELDIIINTPDTTARPVAMVRDSRVALLFYKQHGQWFVRAHNIQSEHIAALRVLLSPLETVDIQPAHIQVTALAGHAYSTMYPLTIQQRADSVDDTTHNERADLEQRIQEVSQRITELRRLYGVAGPIQRDEYRLQIELQQKVLQQHKQDLEKLPSSKVPTLITLRVNLVYTMLDMPEPQVYEDTVRLDLE